MANRGIELEMGISEKEMRGLRRSLDALSKGVQKRVLRFGLNAGAGVFKTALRAGKWPKRTGELKRSFIVRSFGNYGRGIGPRYKRINVGRAKLKSGRLGKLKKETKATRGKLKDRGVINPAKYAHLVENPTKNRARWPGLRIMAKVSRSEKASALGRAVAIMRREMAREATKAYALSKGT